MDTIKSQINFNQIKHPVILHGRHAIAYRDPAACCHEGIFKVFHTLGVREEGYMYAYIAVIESTDLLSWTMPKIITQKDLNLNYSSPGNIIRFKDKWIICFSSYPLPKPFDENPYATDAARIWKMESHNLSDWSEPELLRVKGPDVPMAQMGRMIDPYLLRDKDDKDKWWCFYKQDGVSMSYTYDFKTWTYYGKADAGENACVLVEGNEYILYHSPENGIGIKKSHNLTDWKDEGLLLLGQSEWKWAQGRITAGCVLDLREEPLVGKCIMFFHGSTEEDMPETHGAASLAMAWSDDLYHWEWPEGK